MRKRRRSYRLKEKERYRFRIQMDRSSFLWALVDCKFITRLKRYLIFNCCWFTQITEEFNCFLIATTPSIIHTFIDYVS